MNGALSPAAQATFALTGPAGASAPNLPKTADIAKIRAAAEDFEAFFVSSMLEGMFAGIGTDGMFGGGQGESVFRSLLLQEYGKTVAAHGGIGIADAVQREMLRLQEVQTE